LESHGFDPGNQGTMVELVPSPPFFQPLLLDNAKSLTQSIVHRNGSCMMIGAILAPVFGHHRQIQVPALHLGFSPPQGVQSFLRYADWRQTRRTAQAFLGAAVGKVDSMAINPHRMPAQRGDAITQEESVWKLIQNLPDVRKGSQHSSGSLSMD